MSDLNKALSETINNQNEVSDFINMAADSQAPGVSEAKGKLEAAAPAAQEIKRGRGRPKGSGKNQNSPQKSFIPKEFNQASENNNSVENNIPPINAEDGKAALQRKNAAAGATIAIQTTGQIIAGDEGKMGADEFSNVQENFERYFIAKGISDFPPGIALGLALGGYYVRVLTTEKVRPKTFLFLGWIKNKIFSFKKKKSLTPPEMATGGA